MVKHMININTEAIGNLIQQLLKENNLSIRYFAEQLKVSKVSVGEWIKGKRPSIVNICNMADIFHVTVDEIVNGKLHNEGTLDYLNRNFNLSEFDLDNLIEKKDINGLSEYLRRCISIKNRFIILLNKWSNNTLSAVEQAEYEYITKYIRIDNRLFGDDYHLDVGRIFEDKEDKCLKACVQKYFANIAYLREEEEEDWYWEVEKLIEYNFNIKAKEIIELGSSELISLLGYLLNQQHRDELLALNLNGKNKEDISNNECFGALLDCGANYIYRMRSIHGSWDEEIFNLLEGKIVEDIERTEAIEATQMPRFDASGKVQIYSYKDEWKTMSYKDYKKTINTKRTKYLNDLCKLKYLNPLQYFENLESGKYDDYFKKKDNLQEAIVSFK